jgi:hypothetical protein
LNLEIPFERNEIHAASFRENKLVAAAVATPKDRFQAADSFFFWNTVSMNHWLMVAGQLGHMTLKGRKKSKPVTGCRRQQQPHLLMIIPDAAPGTRPESPAAFTTLRIGGSLTRFSHWHKGQLDCP